MSAAPLKLTEAEIERRFVERRRVTANVWYACWIIQPTAFIAFLLFIVFRVPGEWITGAGVVLFVSVILEQTFMTLYFRCPVCGNSLVRVWGRGFAPCLDATVCRKCGTHFISNPELAW